MMKPFLFTKFLLFVLFPSLVWAQDPVQVQDKGSAILEASLNGKLIKFERKLGATMIKENNSLTIMGQTSDDIFNAQNILLNISSVNLDTKISKGEYKIVPEDDATTYLVRAEYVDRSGGNGSYWWSNTSVVKGGSIIIEEITDTHIKGKFSFTGVFENEDGSMNAKNLVKVTKGVFDLPLKIRSVLDPQ